MKEGNGTLGVVIAESEWIEWRHCTERERAAVLPWDVLVFPPSALSLFFLAFSGLYPISFWPQSSGSKYRAGLKSGP